MMWYELYNRGIDVEKISEGSSEYNAMIFAAIHGSPSAQYCCGVWEEKVNKNPDSALHWIKEAAARNFGEAFEALNRMERKQASKSVTEDKTEEENADNAGNQVLSRGINKQKFLEAKNSLRKYTEQSQKDIELSRVPTEKGLFRLEYKVTGNDLNGITSKIQEYLINLNKLSEGLVDEFRQVYKVFEILDNEYISGIVDSIDAVAKVSNAEKKDRADIKKLVEQHKTSIDILKKFKDDIDKLKHLTDIDKAWELIENQTKLSEEFSGFMAELSKVKHLKDVDGIYADFEKMKIDFSKMSDLYSKHAVELKAVHEYCNALSSLQHIKDVDELWDTAEVVTKDIQHVKKSLEDKEQAISDFHRILQRMQESQQQFVDGINQLISNFSESLNNRFSVFSEAHTSKLNDINRNYADTIEKLSIEQREKLASIEKSLVSTLDSSVQKQNSSITKIEQAQKEKFEELSASQASALEQIANDQSGRLEQVNQSLETEKAVLNEQVNVLSQKVKLLYIVAGGAAAVTVIQLLLNILGIL